MIADVCLSLAVLTGLAVGTVLAGRAVVVLFRIGQFCDAGRRRTCWLPPSWEPRSRDPGFRVLFLPRFGGAAGRMGGAGADRGRAIAVVAEKGDAPGSSHQPRRRLALAVVLAPILIADRLLLRVIFGDGFVFYTDSILYDNVAELAADPRLPRAGHVRSAAPNVEIHRRLAGNTPPHGADFLLALVLGSVRAAWSCNCTRPPPGRRPGRRGGLPPVPLVVPLRAAAGSSPPS